jgi:hypothetical protein
MLGCELFEAATVASSCLSRVKEAEEVRKLLGCQIHRPWWGRGASFGRGRALLLLQLLRLGGEEGHKKRGCFLFWVAGEGGKAVKLVVGTARVTMGGRVAGGTGLAGRGHWDGFIIAAAIGLRGAADGRRQ